MVRDYIVHLFQVLDHKALVFLYAGRFCSQLMCRVFTHDLSKLLPDEARGFSRSARIFRKIPYGGPLYHHYLEQLGNSLALHYLRCKHHPQHYKGGIEEMDLLDLVEMFYDWAAASKRQARGSLKASVRKNKERFFLSSDLAGILMNERDRIRGKR